MTAPPPLRVVPQRGAQEPDPDVDSRPTILVKAGELPRVVDEAMVALNGDALRLLSRPPSSDATAGSAPMIESGIIVQRGGRLVRIVRMGGQRNGVDRAPAAPEIVAAELDYVVERLTTVVRFEKYDGRTKTVRPIDCPEKIARTLLARLEYPGLPDLAAVVETPIVTADGRLLQEPGFDARTGLLLDFPPDAFPRVPDKPTRQQAEAALAVLDAVLGGFAFADDVDRAAAIAMLLTAIVRPALPSAPLFLVTAPAAGSGKTLLARVAAILRSGREPAITVYDGNDPAEFSKRLFALLFAGDPVVVLDNVEGELGGADLCAALTAPQFQARVLGASEMRRVPSSALWIATGNNVRPRGDLTRRVLDVRLDTRLEHPGDRVYQFDPIERVYEDRVRLVAAALTVIRAAASRAWRGKFRPPAPFPSFELWSRLVRLPLVALGLPDPCAKVREAEDLDPERQQVRAVFAAWRQSIGTEAVTLADVIARAQALARRPDERDLAADRAAPADRGLLDALLDVGQRGGELNRRAIGKWLARFDRRIEQGHELQRMGDRCGVALWRIVDVTGV